MNRATSHRLLARNDDGATAVFVALLAVVIFGIAALAVELTDMFSRDRAVQTTADLAAFAGAQDLPDSCAAFDSALEYLNSTENGVLNADGTTDFAATAAQMDDGDRGNGEIEILDTRESRLDLSSCPTTGRIVRVVTPPRTVDFAFAQAMPDAPDSGDVQAVAAVSLRGLDVSVLPLSLPSNCPSGPNYLYVDNGAGIDSTDPDPVYDPRGSNNGPKISAVVPDTIAVGGAASVEVSVTDLAEDPVTVPVWFDFHLRQPDGTTIRQPGPAPTGVPGAVISGSVVPKSGQYRARFIVALPGTIQTTEGSWKVRAGQAGRSGVLRWTPADAVGTLTVGTPSSAGCPNPSTGDFGLLNSPRQGRAPQAEERFLNFVTGLDHELMRVTDTDPDVPCSSDGIPYEDGILDDNEPPVGGESCIDVKPGEPASLPTNGLIKGAFGVEGRLVGTRPAGARGDDCRVDGDDNLEWQTNGVTIVDTVLSCYLADGFDLDDVRQGVPGSLRQEIAEDPRFFFIPITDTTLRPKNASGSGAQFWPIADFRGAFVTNESNGGDATCVGPEDCNGLLFNGGGTQLKAVQAFTFPLDALPEEVEQPGNGGFWYGGAKDFLLTE